MRERTRPAPAAGVPWIVRVAARMRWAVTLALMLIGIRLLAPGPDGWRRWNDASAALLDVQAARTAALLYYEASARVWPAPGRFGEAPAGVLPFLEAGSFGRARYRLAWEYASDTTNGSQIIGISVISDDPLLALTIAKRSSSGMAYVVSGGRFTALIASAMGR